MPQAPAAPPPPPSAPSLSSATVQATAAQQRTAAAAAAGTMGFGRTIKSSPQGAAKPATATPNLMGA